MLNVVAPTKKLHEMRDLYGGDEMSEFSSDIDIDAQQERLECCADKVFKGQTRVKVVKKVNKRKLGHLRLSK